MKKLSGVLFAFLFLVVCAQVYSSTVIGFEDLYITPRTSSRMPPGYEGFIWSEDFFNGTSTNLDPRRLGTGYENGTIDEIYAFTSMAQNVSMSMSEGSFDFLGAYVTAAWNKNQDFRVEGWRNGRIVYSKYNITSYDKAYWFEFNFLNVDTVWFKPGTGGVNGGFSGSGHHLVIDNITIIPEPATLMLLVLGGVVLRKK